MSEKDDEVMFTMGDDEYWEVYREIKKWIVVRGSTTFSNNSDGEAAAEDLAAYVKANNPELAKRVAADSTIYLGVLVNWASE